ncbi:MAG: hypothetical protein ACKVQB_01640 [Bacteroidia bacterium]
MNKINPFKISINITFLFVSCYSTNKYFGKRDSNQFVMMDYSSDVFITHTSFSYFATQGIRSDIQLMGKEKESYSVDLGNFYFNDSLLTINGKRTHQFSDSYNRSFNRHVGNTVNFKYDGNDSLGFEPYASIIKIVKALKSNMSPLNFKVDLTKDFKIEWEPENKKDYLAIYVKWYGDRNIQIPKLWSKFIKDNGSFIIPNSVFKDYSPKGKVDIDLVRFSSVSKKSGKKKVFILSKSTLSSLFRIAKPD